MKYKENADLCGECTGTGTDSSGREVCKQCWGNRWDRIRQTDLANQLKCTRQNIHDLIKRGVLDAYEGRVIKNEKYQEYIKWRNS